MAFLLYFLRIIFMTPGHLNYEWGKFLFMESVGDNSYSFTYSFKGKCNMINQVACESGVIQASDWLIIKNIA